jgi:hypothetical protein
MYLGRADPLCPSDPVGTGRVEDGRGSLEPFGKRPVSHPRSSNPTCRFPALGFPIDFTARHTTVGRSMWHRARIPRRVTTFACDMSFL